MKTNKFSLNIAWGYKAAPVQQCATMMSLLDLPDTEIMIKEFQDKTFWALTALFKDMLIKEKASLIIKYWILGYRKGMDTIVYDRAAHVWHTISQRKNQNENDQG